MKDVQSALIGIRNKEGIVLMTASVFRDRMNTYPEILKTFFSNIGPKRMKLLPTGAPDAPGVTEEGAPTLEFPAARCGECDACTAQERGLGIAKPCARYALSSRFLIEASLPDRCPRSIGGSRVEQNGGLVLLHQLVNRPLKHPDGAFA